MREINNIPYKHLNVLIMPTDYCNMNCVYCFNYRRTVCNNNKISLDTIKHLFEITIPFYNEVKFIWHGGEPLSMGISFFEHVIYLQRTINKNGTIIRNSIQTNLTLMTDEFADFLISNNFKIGSSFDGVTNEKTRHNSEKILKGHRLLVEKGMHNGFIYVVQNNNINHLIEDYNWFKKENIGYNINLYMADKDHITDDLQVSDELYVKNIIELFEYWAFDIQCSINIGLFDDYILYILYKEKHLCCYNSCIGKYVGILYDGTIINCNRDFPNEYSFGNVNDYMDIRESFQSEGFNLLLEAAIKRRNVCMDECELYDFCQGGCNSNSCMSGAIEKSNEYVCSITKKLYNYIYERVTEIMTWSVEQASEKLNPQLYGLLEKALKSRN